jgi:hypothetical protein
MLPSTEAAVYHSPVIAATAEAVPAAVVLAEAVVPAAGKKEKRKHRCFLLLFIW